jgi:hypothetical protein
VYCVQSWRTVSGRRKIGSAIRFSRCTGGGSATLTNLHLRNAGTGDATRLLANEWGPEVKTVKVYWHVLREGSAFSQGNIPRDAINKQMAVLNQKFAPANIQFSVSIPCYAHPGIEAHLLWLSSICQFCRHVSLMFCLCWHV